MTNDFIIKKEVNLNIYIPSSEKLGVKIACHNLCKDLYKVFHITTSITNSMEKADIIVHTDSSKFNDNGEAVWEGYEIKVHSGKLIITGSMMRGTIYGIYEISKMIGVSPWYYFADVPINTLEKFCIPEGIVKMDSPSVKYRGIFLNDEEELESWAIEHMNESTIGPNTYSKIFELLLRLGANYIWPAMHVNAFNNNTENGKLADEMGIVVGTSHCDMLLRSNQNEWEPWKKKKGYEQAEYDYSIEGINKSYIKEYWRESLEQNKGYDVTYTLGMRGIHDSGFITKNIKTKEDKIKLLQKVIEDQRTLIKEVDSQNQCPQIFIPYKEVLDLYDAGLNVPDDVTLIWVNDNFGYMRRYPNEEERKRSGGHGLYYHASYWAHPGMSYLFFNSSPLAQMKNELKKAYENGIQNLWVLNVGALKPLEIDMSFFLSCAWEIGKKEERTKDVKDFIRIWTNEMFQNDIGTMMSEIYTEFTQLLNVKKLEHMKPNSFSQTAYGNEFAHRLERMRMLFHKTTVIHSTLPKPEQDSFFQLFAMKIYAAYFINASFYYGDRSTLMYENGDMELAEKYTGWCRTLDDYKRVVIDYYNHYMSDGKWNKILTPEQFLPPCTALYPAATPALMLREKYGIQENNGYVSILANQFTKNTGWEEIQYLGREQGSVMEAHSGMLTYSFELESSGEFLLELYRLPTLNATGQIRIKVVIDGNYEEIIETEATDEWRGNWRDNILNNVDKLYMKLPYMEKGRHDIGLVAVDEYAAISKLVIYTKEYEWSQVGPQDYSDEKMDELTFIMQQLFHKTKAPLPEVIYGDGEFWTKPRLYLKNVTKQQHNLGDAKYAVDSHGYKNVYELLGNGIFTEEAGVIAFGTETALENSDNAYVKADKNGVTWRHTASETNGRTGIAMYIPQSNMFWSDTKDSPSLNYKIQCDGGNYYVWLLLKYDDEKNARLSLYLDENEIAQEKMYNNGYLFNYGTQQNWVWLVVSNIEMKKGIHNFSIHAMASEIRIDRIFLTRRLDYPPVDAEWKDSNRVHSGGEK